MNFLVKVVIILLTGFCTLVWSADKVVMPQALLYKGKPIDPLCFFEAGNTNGNANLSQCGLHAEPGRHISKENTYLTDKGFFGYDFSWEIDDKYPSGGYSYYKPFGTVGKAVIVETINNGGGTGDFTAINLVVRDNETISVDSVNGGDRCNNGIQEVKREKKDAGERLVYGIKVTPFDFLTLVKDNAHDIQPYDDLNACAICCAGVAYFQRPLDDKFENETFMYLNVSNYIKDIKTSDSASQGEPVKYQACFDKVLLQSTKDGNSKLDKKALALCASDNETKLR